MSIKDSEINLFKRDYVTLVELMNNLSGQYLSQKEAIEQFASEQASVDNVDAMLNGRYYLQDMQKHANTLHLSLKEVEKQKEAAFETLSSAVTGLKVLEKMHDRRLKDLHSMHLKKEELESDEVAITMFNKVNN